MFIFERKQIIKVSNLRLNVIFFARLLKRSPLSILIEKQRQEIGMASRPYELYISLSVIIMLNSIQPQEYFITFFSVQVVEFIHAATNNK